MARKVSHDSCMFCGDEPCDMHKPKDKPAPKARKKVVKVAPVVAEPPPVAAPVPDDPPMPATPPKAALHAAMRAHAKPPAARTRPVLAGDDPVMDDAIRALAPILHQDEKRNRRDVLSQPRTVEVRAQAWRERRRGIA